MNLIEILKLQLKILKLQLAVLLLRQKRTIPNLPEPTWGFLHHGAGDWDFARVNKSHRWWKMPDGSIVEGKKSSLGFWCGYQKFIELSGKVYIARLDTEEGAHTVGYNKTSVGWCLQGNTELEDMTKLQKIELKKIIDADKLKYGWTNKQIRGHRRVKNTLCPGKYAYKFLLREYPDVS